MVPKLTSRADADELEWHIPSAILPKDLQRCLNTINQYLETPIDLFLWCFLWLLARFFWCLFFINFPPCYLFRPVFVVGIVRVGRVEERELWVVTLSLTNLLLELRWVRGASNESGSSINYGYKDTKQMHTVSNYLGHRI